MDGALLILGALPLIPLVRRVEARLLWVVLAVFAGLQIAYGIALAVQDGWGEQIWKRGWTGAQIPSLTHPALTLWWLGIVAVGCSVAVLVLRSGQDDRDGRHAPDASEVPGTQD